MSKLDMDQGLESRFHVDRWDSLRSSHPTPGNQRCRRNTGSSGFTLLETLVAFTIAALALGVTFQIFAGGTRAVIIGDEYLAAVSLAETRLAGFGSDDTRQGSDGPYTWRIDVQDYEGAGDDTSQSPLALQRVTVTVEWPARSGMRNVSLATLRPAPAK